MNAGISIGIVISILVIVFSGLLWMLTPFNPENHSQAKKVLTNAVIGLLIILSAWLIVDFVMKVLYSGTGADSGKFGPWNKILVGGNKCVTASTDLKPLFSGDLFTIPSTGPANVPVDATQIATARVGTGGCSPEYITTMAGKSGSPITPSNAATLSCIAVHESTCGTRLLNYNWGKGSSAAGLLQVTIDSHSSFFENATCRAAAGVSPTTVLNCTAGFNKGNAVPGSAIAERCTRAAKDPACNVALALQVLKSEGYGAWTHDPKSNKQEACIARFGNG